MTSACIRPVFVSGDRCRDSLGLPLRVARWNVTRIEELAYQRWEGERIAEETFFYDPGQLAPKPEGSVEIA